jgi:Transposase IS66 family
MRWELPDRTEDHYPQGECACGRDLADAADLGVTRSYRQEEIPAVPAEQVQRDLHEVRCVCGRPQVAARPAGVPDSALSVGPRLRALAVYLVFQHVPVERCQQLIAEVTGAAVSAGFVHSCLRQAASLAAEVARLIRILITAAAVAGFDETTLRSGPGRGEEVRPRPFTEEYSAFWLGARSLDSMADAGILPEFAGVVVSDRYQNYFHPRWKHIAGNQACLAHILRDYQDCAETYPGAVWPQQAQRALRGLIRAWHAAASGAWPPSPPTWPIRWRTSSGTPSLRAWPACRAYPARNTPPDSGPAASCWNSAATAAKTCSGSPRTRASGPRTTSVNAASAAGNPAENLRPPDQRRRHPGPARHPQLHRHRPQARQDCVHCLVRPHDR